MSNISEIDEFDPKKVRFPKGTRTDMPLFYKEVEVFCNVLAESPDRFDIAWMKLSGEMGKSKSQYKSLCQKFIERIPLLQDRINYLQGLSALELYDKRAYTRDDNQQVLIDIATNDDILPRDRVAAADKLNQMNGWNAPIEVKQESTMKHVLDSLNLTHAQLPSLQNKPDFIETRAIPIPNP